MTKIKIQITDLTADEVDQLIDDLEYAWMTEDGCAKPAAVLEIYSGLYNGTYFPGKSVLWDGPNLLGDLDDLKKAM